MHVSKKVTCCISWGLITVLLALTGLMFSCEYQLSSVSVNCVHARAYVFICCVVFGSHLTNPDSMMRVHWLLMMSKNITSRPEKKPYLKSVVVLL